MTMPEVASSSDGSDGHEWRPGERTSAVSTIVGSGMAATALGSSTLSLVREQLHIHCGTGQPGSEGAGSWVCSDGIGYLWIAVVLGAMLACAVFAGSLVAGLVRPQRVACALLVGSAAAATAWVLAWTWHGSNELVWSVPPGVRSVDYWYAEVLPAAIVSGVAFLPALLGLTARGASARLLFSSGAAGLVVATILQPGLGMNTLAAAGLLAAAAVRTPSRPPPTAAERASNHRS